ncbi:hypothetical protein JYG23_09675 [Sedimentibacter sp. zth1]|uniref:hypothetical protein n=1 Tax=Sedimentibacter sp. zth1 TaxID=2816908 RepID=UPI001A925FFF|nr:hypothetical protein [Sedimentibacter sp. zth1]QSX04958.1 hypothetical protein JYG23_09675 [Sedimentibacter sp. zth1]
MKKKYKLLIFILLILVVLTACKAGKNNDTVHIWMYGDKIEGSFYNALPSIRMYCLENNIPLEVHYFTSKEMTYEDYILKRNVSLAQSNSIVWGRYREMQSLPTQHADYNKIKNYKNVGDNFKKFPFIACSHNSYCLLLNEELLDYYDINIEEDMISYSQYINLVFELIDKGARFTNEELLKKLYIDNIVNNYSLRLSTTATEKDLDDNYKLNLINAIKKIASDNFYDDYSYTNALSNQLIDQHTNLPLWISFTNFPVQYWFSPMYSNGESLKLVENLKDGVVVFRPGVINNGIYISDKVTNEHVYDIVNYILSPEYIKLLNMSMVEYYYTFNNDLKYYLYDMEGKYTGYDKYYEKNEKVIKKLDKVINDNIKGGNLEQKYVEMLSYDYFLSPNFGLSIFITDEVNKLLNNNLDNVNLEDDVDDMINKLKLKF